MVLLRNAAFHTCCLAFASFHSPRREEQFPDRNNQGNWFYNLMLSFIQTAHMSVTFIIDVSIRPSKNQHIAQRFDIFHHSNNTNYTAPSFSTVFSGNPPITR